MSFKTFALLLVPLAFWGGFDEFGLVGGFVCGLLYLSFYFYVVLRD